MLRIPCFSSLKAVFSQFYPLNSRDILEMGPDLQGSDDDHGGGRPAGASRHYPGVQRRKYASTPRQRKPEGRQLTRRTHHPLGLRSAEGGGQRVRNKQKNDETVKYLTGHTSDF